MGSSTPCPQLFLHQPEHNLNRHLRTVEPRFGKASVLLLKGVSIERGQVAAIGPELGVGSDRAAADSERLERDAEEEFEWWKRSVFYQIFPRFQCSDGEGEGDLPGIIARLDYLVWLGIDAVWLSPIHPSPFLDGG